MVIEDHIDVVHLHQGCILLLQASLGSPEDFIYIYNQYHICDHVDFQKKHTLACLIIPI